MMSMSLEDGTVAAFAAVQEPRNACDGGCTGRSALRSLAVTDTCEEEPCHFQTLAQCLQFGKGRDVAKEIPYLLLFLAGEKCLTETPEQWIRSPGAFGEASFSHNSRSLPCPNECVNVIIH